MPANFVQSGFSLIRPDANMLAGIFLFGDPTASRL
jgi:hypothetical protein